MAVSESNRDIAKYLRSVIGGSPKVTKFWDEAEARSVDVLSVEDAPVSGVTSAATIGLSDRNGALQAGGKPLGVEVLIALASSYGLAREIVATTAFSIMDRPVKPGAVVPDVVRLHDAKATLPHVMLVSPVLWELETRDLPEKKVAWLQVVPISDSERGFVADKGGDALETLFERAQVDLFTLERPPVV